MDDKREHDRGRILEPVLPEEYAKVITCLQKKGFTRDQSLRALANTGYKSLRQALFWLCLHVDDPLLMVDVLQDYFVLLCIDGDFGERLEEFRDGALNILGWEPSLDHPPCVDILRLEVPPAAVPHIHHFFRMNSNSFKSRITEVGLDLVPAITKDPNSIGLNFTDSEAKSLLQDFSKSLAEDITQHCPNVTVVSEPQGAYSFADLTVAYAFVSEQFVALCQLYDTCMADTGSSLTPDWSIRLYSRDPRLRIPDPQVYEMMTTIEADLVSFLDGVGDPLPDPDENGSASIGPQSAPTALTDSNRKSASNGGRSQPLFSNPTVSEPVSTTQQTASHPLYHLKPSSELSLLSYSRGDYVLLVGSCCPPGRQGCPLGVNLATGLTGMFNLCTGSRVPQYHTWVLHCSIPINTQQVQSSFPESPAAHAAIHGTSTINGCSVPSMTGGVDSSLHRSVRHTPRQYGNHQSTTTQHTASGTEHHPASTAATSSSCFPGSCAVNLHSAGAQPEALPLFTSKRNSLLRLPHSRSPSSLSDRMNGDLAWSGRTAVPGPQLTVLPSPKSRMSAYFRPSNGSAKGRQLFVMRHAERVDICFGRSWVTRFFDKKGVYRRSNLNLPAWLPPRADYLDYVLDSPITQVGLFVAAETGRCLAEAGVRFTMCYSSPSLRCVQTACELLRAMGRPDLLVRIEPHLFEWFGWYGNCAPRMMSPHDLRACGYQVDVNYRSFSSNSDFDPEETISNYYDRTGGLTRRLLSQHKTKDACILIVAHASSLDTCTHQLVHHGFRTCISSEEFQHRTSGVPYCGLVVAQENRRWTLVNPPIPNVCSYTHNPDFEWRQLLSPTLCGFTIK